MRPDFAVRTTTPLTTNYHLKGSTMSDTKIDEYTKADLESHEQDLQLGSFSHEDAVALGLVLLEGARAAGHVIAVAVDRGNQRVFQAALPGTCSDHNAWLERKFAAVRHFDRASLELERRVLENNTYLDERQLDRTQIVLAGGAFPIRVNDVLVGVIGVAGLRSVDDHRFVVDSLKKYIKSH
ncbi:UPF0303 protein (plasmid) [Arthrobacter sp. StoSoilB3]|nr:UPF0303 protein [Arthrobacter sp. StoSoilB3]